MTTPMWEVVSNARGRCDLCEIYIKDVAEGGSLGARDSPFVNYFLSKQPIIFRWRGGPHSKSGEYPLCDTG